MALFRKNKNTGDTTEESYKLFEDFANDKKNEIARQIDDAKNRGAVLSQNALPNMPVAPNGGVTLPLAGQPQRTAMIMEQMAEQGMQPSGSTAVPDGPGSLVGTSICLGKRTSQQDAIMVSDGFVAGSFKQRWLGVLCDGMGGMNGGERASAMGVNTTIEAFRRAEQQEAIDFPAFYQDVIAAADYEVSSLEDETGRYLGAGTTFISVAINSGVAYWASVGDSHIYIIRGGQISMIVKEHNYLQDLLAMVEKNEITLEEAYSDKSKDALTSYIGMGGVQLMEIGQGLQLQPGDIFVLCSDGLYRTVKDEEILSIVLANAADMNRAAVALTDYALARNNPYQDNLSVITAKYQ